MSPREPEILRDRGKSLEDEFFRREDQRLIKRLAELKAAETTREGLAKASGITNPADSSISPISGWESRAMSRAILDRAGDSGIAPGSAEHTLLEAWLDRRPEPKLITAWTHMVQGMAEQLGPEGTARLKAGLLERARAVAAASGGVLGLGSKISSAEAALLAELEAAFAS